MTSPGTKIKKICLLHPPYTILKGTYKHFSPPLGILYLGAVLEAAGFEVYVIDSPMLAPHTDTEVDEHRIRYGLSLEGLVERILEGEPDMVGASVLFSSQYPATDQILRRVKERAPNVVTVMGGGHPSLVPKEVLASPGTDYIVVGEGEKTFLNMIERIELGRSLEDLDGVAYSTDTDVIVKPQNGFIEDLDTVPFPAWHLLDMEGYFKLDLPHGTTSYHPRNAPMMASRGCPAKCVFCSSPLLSGKKYRGRSPQNIVDEIVMLKKQYGIKEVRFLDDNLTLNKARSIELFDLMIKSKVDIKWCAPNGIPLWARYDDELVEKMAASGCYAVSVAIETGSQRVMDEVINKPLRLAIVPEVVDKLKTNDINVHSFFITGFPGETKEEMEQTFKFARTSGVDTASFFAAAPLPGTKLLEECKDKGILRPEYDSSKIDYNRSYIDRPDISSDYIEKRIAKETLMFNASLAWRSPKAFYPRLGRLIVTKPMLVLDLVGRYLKTLSRRLPRSGRAPDKAEHSADA